MKKKYLIIGSSSHIAKSLIALELEKQNEIYSISRSESQIQHDRLVHQKLNMLEEDLPQDFIPESLDGLIYFPGTIKLKPFRAIKEESFLDDFKIHVLGAIRTVQQTLKRFNENSSSIQKIN